MAGYAEIVAALISAGVNVNKANKDGATALGFASENNHPSSAEISAALVAAGASSGSS